MADFDVKTHIYVPKHEILTEEETKKILEKYNISLGQLPRILKNDPAIKNMNPEVGQVVRIHRKSPTIGKTEYYRVVVNA